MNPSEIEGPCNVNESLNRCVSEQAEHFGHIGEGLSAISKRHVDSNLTDSVHSKHRSYYELPAANISELMKLNSLQTASSRSLFTIVNNILEEGIEGKHADRPQPVSSLLKLIVQEIKQRASKQAENLKKQSFLYKSREERYQSRIKALETLSMGTTEENKVIVNQLQQIKIEKARIDEERKLEKQEFNWMVMEKVNYEIQISSLKRELEFTIKTHEENCLQLETLNNETKFQLEKRITELERILADSQKRVQELEDFSESKYVRWKKKELGYKHFIDSHIGSIQDLRKDSECLKQELLKTKRFCIEEFNNFELEVKGLVDVAQNYHTVLAENRKLFNEVQDLKGNIRVYCRVRPFHQDQSKKQTTIEYIGDNGELVVANPLKQGKDTHRVFKFNKVFAAAATQEDVFEDTRPLIRSVLDGYNVCIFAYGQTGSGKTFTMTGPSLSSTEEWGVNCRALNDLFNISQGRKSSIKYEVSVQMVEIYNEQVRDLLINETSQKNLGILNSTQSNGLTVPDASMHVVTSTSDVLQLMNIGLLNRVVGATALNERSSRSHSVLTVHVKGTDLETRAILHGCLHLVDLAGSERVDRSEATGDRLREAQHINKSLSALGDVISALAQKSPHIPYRNSKLTQLLQSSLGGQAKTLMFVQLNPDVESYSETLSTLKFAERVSGVELGVARRNVEGRRVSELIEQVASLQGTVSKKDEEIGQLKQQHTNSNVQKRIMKSSQSGSASLRRTSSHESFSAMKKTASEFDVGSECSEKYSESISQVSTKYFKLPYEFSQQSRPLEGLESWSIVADEGVNVNEEVDLLGSGNSDSGDKLSDMSDGVMSMATETDGCINIVDEYTLFLETPKPPPENSEKRDIPAKLPRPPQKHVQSGFSMLSINKRSSKAQSSKKSKGDSSAAVASSKRWQ